MRLEPRRPPDPGAAVADHDRASSVPAAIDVERSAVRSTTLWSRAPWCSSSSPPARRSRLRGSSSPATSAPSPSRSGPVPRPQPRRARPSRRPRPARRPAVARRAAVDDRRHDRRRVGGRRARSRARVRRPAGGRRRQPDRAPHGRCAAQPPVLRDSRGSGAPARAAALVRAARRDRGVGDRCVLRLRRPGRRRGARGALARRSGTGLGGSRRGRCDDRPAVALRACVRLPAAAAARAVRSPGDGDLAVEPAARARVRHVARRDRRAVARRLLQHEPPDLQHSDRDPDRCSARGVRRARPRLGRRPGAPCRPRRRG